MVSRVPRREARASSMLLRRAAGDESPEPGRVRVRAMIRIRIRVRVRVVVRVMVRVMVKQIHWSVCGAWPKRSRYWDWLLRGHTHITGWDRVTHMRRGWCIPT